MASNRFIDLKSYSEECITKEKLEIITREEKYSLVGLTKSFHLKVYNTGSSCSGSFDYYSTIKVVRNYTDVKVPNILAHGSFLLGNISYDYLISERIEGGVTLSRYQGEDKNKMLTIIEEYKKQIKALKVERMGRLYFSFRAPKFPYYILENFPCTMIGDYEANPKILINNRISTLVSTLVSIRSKYPNLEFFKEYSTEDVEKRSRGIIDCREIEFSFQHCDLHHDNIVISDKKEVFLVDWEVAGVYPDHYGKSRENCMTGKYDNQCKLTMLEQVLIEFHRVKDLDLVRDEHIFDIMKTLSIFMNRDQD
jgi:hypothetical protein